MLELGKQMGLLEELEDLAGPTRSLIEIHRNRNHKNRVVNGVTERICNRCRTWKPLSGFQEIRKLTARGEIKIEHHCACKPCAVRWSREIKLRKRLAE